MILDRSPLPRSVPVLMFAAPFTIAAIAVFAWFLSIPSSAHQRLSDLEAKAASVSRAAAQRGDLKAFPPGSVCSGEISESAKMQINLAVANTGLQIANFDLSDAGPAQGDLETYHLSLKGSGSYEDALAALDVLNRTRPKLFVDTLALRNNVSAVEVTVDGRMFCR